jgi:hypothetical protein
MLQVAQDGELGTALMQKGLARAQSFSWKRTAEATLGGYERACPVGGAASDAEAWGHFYEGVLELNAHATNTSITCRTWRASPTPAIVDPRSWLGQRFDERLPLP